MTNETFTIRAYGKSELAMLYFPHLCKASALRRFKEWLRINPRLSHMARVKGYYYSPKQVRKIVGEVGEPFDTE